MSRCTAEPAAGPWPSAWLGFGYVPAFQGLMSYWYHFAIMFEALFILTTIDTGTRIGRFMVQEFLGRLWKPLGNLDWLPGSILATALVTLGWASFIWTGSVETIWPMFGMANQLLAVIALAIVTTILVKYRTHSVCLGHLAPVGLRRDDHDHDRNHGNLGLILEDDPSAEDDDSRVAEHRADGHKVGGAARILGSAGRSSSRLSTEMPRNRPRPRDAPGRDRRIEGAWVRISIRNAPSRTSQGVS